MKTVPIILNDVEKAYITMRGRVVALKKIDLKVEAGEFFVLLGPSGCGKSTLLNLIAGLEKPTRGEMLFGDQTVAAPAKNIFLSPFQRDIAMVFQSYALYPHMTIEQNIAFPLTNYRVNKPSKSEIANRVRDVSKMLKITELLDRKPSELSGGQRQRVAIGRAAIRNPQIFLLDEPLSNLDAQLRMEMRAQLKALQQELGVTTAYVTHDQLEAMTLADRFTVIHKGYIQQLGTPVDVYARPENTFIARFIGSPSMNLITGKIKVEDGKTYLIEEGYSILVPDEIAKIMKEDGKDEYSIGIRPEDIKIVEKGQGNLDVKVGIVENIGAERLINIFVFFKNETFVVKTNIFDVPSEIALKFPAEKIHLFEAKEDGQRLN